MKKVKRTAKKKVVKALNEKKHIEQVAKKFFKDYKEVLVHLSR